MFKLGTYVSITSTFPLGTYVQIGTYVSNTSTFPLGTYVSFRPTPPTFAIGTFLSNRHISRNPPSFLIGVEITTRVFVTAVITYSPDIYFPKGHILLKTHTFPKGTYVSFPSDPPHFCNRHICVISVPPPLFH